MVAFQIIASPVYAQTTTTTTIPTTAAEPEYYTNTEYGFRFQVPSGWIVDESDDEFSNVVLNIAQAEGQSVVVICPENAAERVIGADLECNNVSERDINAYTIGVSRYQFDLDAATEFREVIEQGRNITADDLLIFELQKHEDYGIYLIQEGAKTVTEINDAVNLVDAHTGEIINSNIPAKIAQFTYRSYLTSERPDPPGSEEIRTRMFVVYNNPEGNQDVDDVKAFAISVDIPGEGETVQDSPPGETLQRPAVKQVFESFELIKE